MDKILIIGGSRGIGRSIIDLIIEDAEIINLSRTAPEIEHRNLSHYEVDVTSDEIPLIEDVNKIIYCPGTINLKPIHSLNIDDFIHDFNVNLLGAVKVFKTYARKLKRQENASILTFSTVAANQGMPFHSSIAAAKGAMEGLTKSLAAELAPQVRVNCIAPSATNTPLAAHLFRNEKAIENMKNRHPLRSIIESNDVAEMAAFLISNKAKAITGQIIGVDAGLSNIKL